MLGTTRRTVPATIARCCPAFPRRMAATATVKKREGTIADAFASLSSVEFHPLEPRFADLKRNLVSGHEEAVKSSWKRLLNTLKIEVQTIAKLGSGIIPELDYRYIDQPSELFNHEYRKRGVAVIRGVIPRDEALELKEDLKRYINANPTTKAFPADNPQVYELYWSPSQIRARLHPNLLKTQKFLLGFWHSSDPHAMISSEPIVYADRLRIRQPGDAKFALGPHIDGGGVERWEPAGYGKGSVYDKIWQGKWEEYDPWEASCRLPVEQDLYNGAGACSAFRMAQGWLSMSKTGPFEGTLLVNPLLSLATAYFLLRPFFTPKSSPPSLVEESINSGQLTSPGFLNPDNWVFEVPQSSWLQGATPGHGQELREVLHPHLRLEETMTHVPVVNPGDYVCWHTDIIHAVDKVHAGKTDSSVLYIPACPLTDRNSEYLLRQREAFLQGIPSPDFPGGVGEAHHIGRPTRAVVASSSESAGMRAMGLERWNSEEAGLSPGEQKVMRRANEILGFH